MILDILLSPFRLFFLVEKYIFGMFITLLSNIFTSPKSRKNNKISNLKTIDRDTLLMDYSSDNEANKKQGKKKRYKYIVRDFSGKVINDVFDASAKIEVHSYLISQGFTVLSIEEDKLSNNLGLVELTGRTKLKAKELIFFLTQLSTYIKAGITLVEAMRILSRQTKNKKEKVLYQKIVFELNSGVNFSEAMEKQGGSFPKLLINMVKTSELTGDLPAVLDDMTEYYESINATRKQLISAMTYPSAILILSIAVLTFVMVYVVPQFVGMYGDIGTSLPAITRAIINISDFISAQYIAIIIIVIISIIILSSLYKSMATFRRSIQYIIMHIPIISNVVKYNELVMFTKTFGSLLKHDVFITDCMDVLSKISNNEIYKEIISNAIRNLNDGIGISEAFKDHWAFPQAAYEMLATGEKTDRIPSMMETVAKYYQEQQRNLVTQLKSLIEPVTIIFLAGMVGVIVLSIVIPMFDLYNQIG